MAFLNLFAQSNPIGKLAVNGNSRIYGTLQIDNTNSTWTDTTIKYKVLVIGSDGLLRTGGPAWEIQAPDGNGDPMDPCQNTAPYWSSLGGVDPDIYNCSANVGIGTIHPTNKLHIKSYSDLAAIRLENTDGANTIIASEAGATRIISSKSVYVFLDEDGLSSDESFSVVTGGHSYNTSSRQLFSVNMNGTAYMDASVNGDWAAVISNGGSSGKGLLIKGGTNESEALLSVKNFAETQEFFKVCGNATDAFTWAKRMKVTLSGFSDFVFENDYELMPLKDLEEYIQANKLLPDIPTESEIKKNDLDLGEMQKLPMQKIEELTLYLIRMNKENEQLKAEIELLKRKSKN